MTKTQVETRLKEIKDRIKWLRDPWNYPTYQKAMQEVRKAQDTWNETNSTEDSALCNERNQLDKELERIEKSAKVPQGAPLTVVTWAERHLVREPKDRREKLVGWTENGLVAVHAPGTRFWNGIGCGQAYSPASVEIYQISRPRKEQGLFGIVEQKGRVSQKRIQEMFKEAEKKLKHSHAQED